MSQLKVFDFNSHKVRTINNGSDAWFNLNDVCEVLELRNPRQVKTRLKEDGVITNDVIDSLGRTQNATFINEPNLYKVIFQSRKEEAEQFQDWVYEEVLPQIRKTGKYEEPKSPMEMLELQFKAMKETNKRVETVEKDVIFLKEEVKLDPGEYNYLTSHISRNVRRAIHSFGFANTREVKKELFRDINRGLNDFCEVATRTQLKQKHFDKAMEYIQIWVPSTSTKLKVQQLSMDFDKEG